MSDLKFFLETEVKQLAAKVDNLRSRVSELEKSRPLTQGKVSESDLKIAPLIQWR